MLLKVDDAHAESANYASARVTMEIVRASLDLLWVDIGVVTAGYVDSSQGPDASETRRHAYGAIWNGEGDSS